MVYGWPTRFAGIVLAGLVAACVAGSPSGEEPEPATAASAVETVLDQQKHPVHGAATPIDWSQGDCLSQLRTLQEAAREGRLGPDEQPPFVVDLVAPSGSWLDGVPDLPIEIDLPLAMADAAPIDGSRCILRIGPARQQSAAHRAVDLQDVHSAYQSALRSERNPDYDAAQLKHRRAKDQAKGKQKIMRTNDPLLDLIGSAVGGAIATFDQHSRGQSLDAAAVELAATPRSRDKPVYRPYSFERVVVRAQKQALVPVALLDAAGRTLQATELRQSERREFFLLRGLDPRDRDYEQHRATSMTRADLARWARTPPALRLSSVAVALTEGTPALDTRLAALAQDTALAPAVPNGDSWSVEATMTVESDLGLEEVLADKDDQDSLVSPEPAPIAIGLQGAGQLGFDIAALAPGDGSAPPVAMAPAAMSGQHPSVVGIEAGSAAGHGFYVRKDLVLTTYGLVGHASVVDVTTANGTMVPALVAATDPAHDLALLHVPRPGPTAILSEGSPGARQLPVDDLGPGRPLFRDDRVIGMTAPATEERPGVIPIETIREFLEGQTGLLAAMP